MQCPDRPRFTAQAHRTTYVSINLDCTSYSDQTAWDFTATQTALLSTPRAGHQPIFALFGHFLDQRLYSTVLHNITSSSLHFAQFGSVLKFVACQRWPSSGACVQINIRFEWALPSRQSVPRVSVHCILYIHPGVSIWTCRLWTVGGLNVWYWCWLSAHCTLSKDWACMQCRW